MIGTDQSIVSIYDAMSLEQIAEEAVTAADAVVRSNRVAVVQAINAGRLLTSAKARLKHGEWADWLEANWNNENRTSRTARVYMQLGETDSDIADATSIAKALKVIADDATKWQSSAILETSPAENLQPIESKPETPVAAPSKQTKQQATPPPRDESQSSRVPASENRNTQTARSDSRKSAESDKAETATVVVRTGEDAETRVLIALREIGQVIQDVKDRKSLAANLRRLADEICPR